MQALDADNCTHITLMTYACSAYNYLEHAHKLASQHGVALAAALAILISLVLRRLHQQLVSEATFDLPDVLQAVPAFRWSRKCAKTARGELQLICILAFSHITFERKVFSKIHLSKSKKSLRKTREYRCLLVSTDAEASTAGTDRYTHTHTHTHRHTHTRRNPRACAPRVNHC